MNRFSPVSGRCHRSLFVFHQLRPNCCCECGENAFLFRMAESISDLILVNPVGSKSLLTVTILLATWLLGFGSRLFAVIRFESIIHEFDPWFNYRATHRLSTYGFYDFLNWFDERAWYPLGRIVGGTGRGDIIPILPYRTKPILAVLDLFRTNVYS